MEPIATNAALLIIDMQKAWPIPPLGAATTQTLSCTYSTCSMRGARHNARSFTCGISPALTLRCSGQANLAASSRRRCNPWPTNMWWKNVPDAFSATGLERWLHLRSIQQLVIVGVITNNSVESTARSGGNLGFDVIVAADACFTFDQTDLSGRLWAAEDVHALSLSNLAMDYARVFQTREILASH